MNVGDTRTAPAPPFRAPIHDGATDPVVIHLIVHEWRGLGVYHSDDVDARLVCDRDEEAAVPVLS